MSAPREPGLGEQMASLLELPAVPMADAPVKPLPIEVTPWLTRSRGAGSEQHLFRFPNGYGASVVRGPGTYGSEEGKYELGVIKFDCPSGVWSGDDQWELTYETPVTGDVLGWLSAEDIAVTLIKVAAL